MRVTKRTKTRDVLPLLDEERARQLALDCPKVPLPRPLLSMTCGEFIEALQSDYPLRFLKQRRALQAFGMMHSFMDELEAIGRYIKRCEVQTGGDEKAAAAGVNFPSLGERILLDNVRHYWLHSTAEAERLPLADWLLTLKADAAETNYQKNLTTIHSRKNGAAK